MDPCLRYSPTQVRVAGAVGVRVVGAVGVGLVGAVRDGQGQ